MNVLKKELVSIILPNYNKAKFIGESIESVLKQTYLNWELIIIDDFSTDESLTIIKKYSLKNNRIILLQNNKNIGGSASRNKGLHIAKGKHIIFLDADDIITKECLKNRIKFIDTKADLDFVVFPVGTFHKTIADSKKIWIPHSKNHLKNFLAHDIPWYTASVIWKKDFLLKIGGFTESFQRLQDVELHTRALLEVNVKYQVSLTDGVNAYYRIDDERIIYDNDIFFTKWTDGVIKYIDFFKKKLTTEKRKNYLHYLKGTFMSTINQLLYQHQIKNITSFCRDELIKKLTDQTKSLNLLTFLDKKILLIYIFLYKRKVNKLKGFNFIFKKLMIYV